MRRIHIALVGLALATAEPDTGRRRVLITGASRGIGREIARKFAAAGHTCCLHYSSGKSAAEETLASLSDDAPHCVVCADLSNPSAATKLVDDAVNQMGGLDIAVVNHGVYEETPFDETDAEAWSESFDRVMRINLHAPAQIAHRAAKHMASQGDDGGAIVFVSSRGAYRGEPLAPAYGASKAALNSLTGSLAQALGPHRIRVAGVAPGFIATDMAKPVLDGPRGDEIRRQSSWARVGDPSEVAACVLFLADEKASWCTGTIVDCNGASYLH